MNIRDIRNDLMSYMGAMSTTALPTVDQEAIVAVYNGTLQKIAALTDRMITNAKVSFNAREARTITADVTQNSTTIANVLGYSSDMAYCSCAAAGDDITNRIVDGTTLLRALHGPYRHRSID
jgi:hypothetical protein